MIEYKEDDLIIANVKRIEGTTIFVDLEEGGQGSLTFSEVSPGRIRNIREFVTVGKKIVCKVLRVKSDHLELSLRRVTTKEREETMEHHIKERTLQTIFKPILGDKAEEVLKKISNEYDYAEFLDKARENPSLLEKFIDKTHIEILKKIFTEKREREKEIKKIVILKSNSSTGLYDIQTALETAKSEADIHYLGSSKFSITVKEKEFKQANLKMAVVLKNIEEKAKTLKIHFEAK